MKKAFSLIELLIVIVIIGVVYTLAVTKLQTVQEGEMTPSLSNLKEYLVSFLKEGEEAQILCFDDCSECSIYVDTQKIKDIESFIDSSVERYRYDALFGPVAIKSDIFFNNEGRQEDVCFSLSVDRHLVADQVMVVYKEKVYDYTPYFEKPFEYDYIEEAVEAKEKLREEAMQ